MSIWYVIGAVLHIGNLRYEAPGGNSEASKISDESQETLAIISSLLHVSIDALEAALTHRTITAKKETYK